MEIFSDSMSSKPGGRKSAEVSSMISEPGGRKARKEIIRDNTSLSSEPGCKKARTETSNRKRRSESPVISFLQNVEHTEDHLTNSHLPNGNVSHLGSLDPDNLENVAPSRCLDQSFNDSFSLSQASSRACSQDSGYVKEKGLCGKLEKLVLKNFMNHRNLEVTFGDRVNFITGKNGSGKSAIVAALLIGLGGRASNTQRGNAVRDLIKKGESGATISIHLSNQGSNPFQHSLFGPTIIIERRITLNSQTYKVKNHREKVINSSGKLVHRILEHFDICIDNPTTILTQDMSREFLATAEPSKMYAFFKQATRLDIIEDDIAVVKENINTSQLSIERKKLCLNRIQDSIKFMEARIKACDSKQALLAKKRCLQIEAVLVDKRDVVSKQSQLEHETSTKEMKMMARDEESQKCEQKLDDLQDKMKELTCEVSEMSSSYNSAAAEVSTKDDEIREKMKGMGALQMSLQSKAEAVHRLEKEIAAMESKSKEMKSRNYSEIVEQSKNLTEMVKNAEINFKETVDKCNAIDHSWAQCNAMVGKLETDVSKLKMANAKFDNDIRNMEFTVNQLKAAKTDERKIFGAYVPQVWLEIEKAESKFSVKPKGPLGMYIKVPTGKYELAVELCVKDGLMTGFLCNNRQDVAVLRQIFDKVIGANKRSYHPQVCVQPFVYQVYDTSPHKTSCSTAVTLQDVIDCEDAVVMNCIIDQVSPESILIFDTLKDARQALIMKQAPAKCLKGIAIDGSEVIPGRGIYPSYKTESKYFKRGDLSQRIEHLQENLATCKADKAQNTREFKQATEQLKMNKQSQSNLVAEKSQLDETKRSLEMQISSWRKELNKMVLDETVQVYEEEIARDREELQSLTERVDELKLQIKNQQDEITGFKSERSELAEKLKAVACEISVKKEELQKMNLKKVELSGSLKFYQERVEQLKKEIDQGRKNMTHLMKQLNEVELKLQKHGFDAEKDEKLLRTRRTKEEIGRLIEDVKAQWMQKQKEIPDNREELEMKLNNRLQEFDSAKNDFTRTEELLMSLEDALKLREKKFYSLRDTTSLVMGKGFSHRLSLRENGYSGELEFDHEKKTLRVLVKTDQKNSTLRNNSQLSGGERSFTTVCFITALWSAVSDCSPFKVRLHTVWCDVSFS